MNNCRFLWRPGISLLLFLSILFCSCGGGGSPPPSPPNPVPSISSVSPSTVTLGAPSLTLTVTGSNFVSASVVQWNGVSEPTTYVDSAHLNAAIPTSAITASNAGNLPVTVATPSPGGGNSNSVSVLVQYPLPSISSLNPSAVVIGASPFTLTVNGSNFASGALVYLNSVSRVTQFVSSTQLTASLLASDLIGAAGNLSVTVQNPSPSAGASNVSPLALQNPSPIVNSVTPTSVLAGNPTFVTIVGSGFVSGATVQVGGQSFSNGFVNSTTMALNPATLPVGSLTLTVTNPSPTVGPSNGIAVTGTPAGAGMSPSFESLNPNGDPDATDSKGGALSATGRYFTYGVYYRDTCLGAITACTPATIQYMNYPQRLGTCPIFGTGISVDGRYISAIETYMCGDWINIFDTCQGVSSGCSPSSLLKLGAGQAGFAISNYLTTNARYTSYVDGANNIAIGDTCIGAVPGCTTTTISVATNNLGTLAPRLSDDGRYLAYANANSQVILHDSCLGAAAGCSPSDSAISTSGCSSASISNDANYVASNCSGLILQATCVNNPPSCNANPISVSPLQQLATPLVSTGGRYVSYEAANATIGGITLVNGMVFVYDSCIGAPSGCTTQSVPVCLNTTGAIANDVCRLVGMTPDGQYILFSSSATNLVPLPILLSGPPYSYIVKNPLF